jgi:hypothetical protein
MKKTLHTPGPWDIFPKNETLEIGNYGANAPLVRLSATVPTNDFEGWANARLIASAPDLLVALESLLKSSEVFGRFDAQLDAREAIRKAKGE